MRVVVALGGNALLKRGQNLSAENQRANVKRAGSAIASLIKAGHVVIISHGNGPQVGLLALQNAAYTAGSIYPLDVLCAESAGMIGYLIEQELANQFPAERLFATLLTRVEVDSSDPAFLAASKPIGPVYGKEEADAAAKRHGWTMGKDGETYRRVVASPEPKRILHLAAIQLLVDRGVTVICAGGGGIPVVRQEDGRHAGSEAVIDKDRTSALLANALDADALLMLTDVDAVYRNWGEPGQIRIKHMSLVDARSHTFAAGSMGPKVGAAASFIVGGGKRAGIGTLDDALAILEGASGTLVTAA